MQAYVQSILNFNQQFYIRSPPKLITSLGISNNYVVKVIKLFYNVLKVGNYLFVTYHIHHKEKFTIIESTYDPCFFYKLSLLEIMGMYTNIILILTENNFASKEEKVIKNTKIITKNQEYLISVQPIKYNRIEIKLNLNGIVLTKKRHVGGIFLVINYDADSTSLKEIIRKTLLPKE